MWLVSNSFSFFLYKIQNDFGFYSHRLDSISFYWLLFGQTKTLEMTKFIMHIRMILDVIVRHSKWRIIRSYFRNTISACFLFKLTFFFSPFICQFFFSSLLFLRAWDGFYKLYMRYSPSTFVFSQILECNHSNKMNVTLFWIGCFRYAYSRASAFWYGIRLCAWNWNSHFQIKMFSHLFYLLISMSV